MRHFLETMWQIRQLWNDYVTEISDTNAESTIPSRRARNTQKIRITATVAKFQELIFTPLTHLHGCKIDMADQRTTEFGDIYLSGVLF